jgi:hypothetical protein
MTFVLSGLHLLRPLNGTTLSQSDELTTELLQKIHESCERKSHARTLDKRHPGAKVADRSRFSENDPHRLRASIHLEKVCPLVVRHSFVLESAAVNSSATVTCARTALSPV